MPRDRIFPDSSEAWGSVGLVYAFVLFKLLLAVTVGAIAVSHSGFSHFVRHTGPGLALYIVSIILWVITMCFLACRQPCPCNCLLFLVWSVSFAVALGFSCSFPHGIGNTFFAAIISITIFVGCLVLYSIWGYIRELDFGLGRFCLFFILLIILIYVPIQIFHPFAKFWIGFWGIFAAILFCARTFFAGNIIVGRFTRSTDAYGDSFGILFEATVLVFLLLVTKSPPILSEEDYVG